MSRSFFTPLKFLTLFGLAQAGLYADTAQRAEPMPIDYWESFDHADGTTAAEIEFTGIDGDPLYCETGELTSDGSGGAIVDIFMRPERVEASFFPSTASAKAGLMVRCVDADNYYLVKVDVPAKKLQIFERAAGGSVLLDEASIPFPNGAKGYHSAIVVSDDGTDLIAELLDFNVTVRASDGGANFNNLFLNADKIGLKAIGADNSRCRYLRAWENVPDWDGVNHVTPAWGAQHIWTKVQERYVGNHDRTYWGWATIWGTVEMRYYDHTLKEFGPIEEIYRYPGGVTWAYDDHHPPGIYVHDDGRVWAWIQSHKSDDPFILLRSENPEDISSWQTPVNMNTQPGAPSGGVYPRAYRVANGDVLLFHRVGGSNDGEWHMRRSSDDGDTWSNTKIIDNSEGHVYQFIRQNPNNRDHLVLVGNHKDANTDPKSWRRAYVWETTDGGTTFQTVTTNQPISLPASRTDLEPVFADATHQLFITGQAIKLDGTPLILAGYQDNPNHQIVALYWDGNAWQMNKVADSVEWPGSVNYAQAVWRPSGGDVNPQNTNEIVIAVAVDGVHEIQRWLTDDGGATWSKSEDVTRNSIVKHFRPRYVENAHPDDFNLLWHAGEFYGTTDAIDSGGRHFDRYDDVLIVNELLVDTVPNRSDKVRPRLRNYSQWRDDNGLPADASGDPDADFDNDGRANGIERMQGTPPDAPDTGAVLDFELNFNGAGFLEVDLHPAVDGGSLTLQLSSDLTDWDPVYAASLPVQAVGLQSNGRLRWRYELPVATYPAFVQMLSQ